MSESDNKYLIFELAGSKYALCFSDVRVIIPAVQPEPIPDFPDYIAGDIVNEGETFTVIDLRVRFGLEKIAIGERSCIVICDTVKKIGVLVDSITGFNELAEGGLTPPPDINSQVNARFINGSFLVDGLPCYVISPELVIRPDDEALFEGQKT